MSVSDYLTGEVQAYTQFGDPVHYENYWQEVNERRRREEYIARLERLAPPQQALTLLEQAKQRSDELVTVEEAAMAAVANGDYETARRLVFGDEYRQHKGAIRDQISAFHALANHHYTGLVQEASGRENRFLLLMTIVTLLFGSVVLASLYFFLVCRIASPIENINTAMHNLAAGHADAQLDIQYGASEIMDLAGSFKRFQDHIVQHQALSAQH